MCIHRDPRTADGYYFPPTIASFPECALAYIIILLYDYTRVINEINEKNKYLCDIRLMIEKLQYLTRQHLESIFFFPRSNLLTSICHHHAGIVVVTYIICNNIIHRGSEVGTISPPIFFSIIFLLLFAPRARAHIRI